MASPLRRDNDFTITFDKNKKDNILKVLTTYKYVLVQKKLLIILQELLMNTEDYHMM